MICPPWQTPWQWQASAYANGDYWMRKLQNFRCLYSLGHCNRWPRISPTSSDLPRKGSGSAEKCTPFGFPSESSCFVTEAGRPECRPMRTRKPRQAPSLLASDLRHAIARQLTVAARPPRVWTLSLRCRQLRPDARVWHLANHIVRALAACPGRMPLHLQYHGRLFGRHRLLL